MSRVAEAVPTLLVAVLTFQGLRLWVCERYLVPSHSMQPHLHGSEFDGDMVLVDKLASASNLRLHDLVVIRDPEHPATHLVKRVAALGDNPAQSWVDLRDGDLWHGADEQDLRRDVKDPAACRDLRVPWQRWPEGPHDAIHLERNGDQPVIVAQTLPDCLAALTPARRAERLDRDHGTLLPPAWLQLVRPVDAGFVGTRGQPGREGSGVEVQDCGCTLTFAAATSRGLAMVIEQRLGTFTWLWQQDGLSWSRDGGPPELVPGTPPMPSDDVHCVEFGYLDGHFFCILDAADRAQGWQPRLPAWQPVEPSPGRRAPPRNGLAAVAIGEGHLTLLQCHVFRDLWYFREAVPFRAHPADFVPPGHAWLLGDNPFDSRDSRYLGAMDLRQFIGRPRAVIGPWPMQRWLPR